MQRTRNARMKDKTTQDEKRKEVNFQQLSQICKGRLVLNEWEDNANVSK